MAVDTPSRIERFLEGGEDDELKDLGDPPTHRDPLLDGDRIHLTEETDE
jgi:hypothetical protein